MKIYILSDMEGVSGICREDQTQPPESPNYQAARPLLCADVNAAIDGAFAGGVDEVLVCDGHASGFNFLMEQMDARATYERPNGALDFLPGLDGSFDAVFCIGYHAMAGTINGFLDHTQDSKSWHHYFINGKRFGELGQIGVWAGSYGVPITLVTGDDAACVEGRAFFGEIATATVKHGIGRQHARCLHPHSAHEKIREAARHAVSLVGKIEPLRLATPFNVRIEYYRSDQADAKAHRPGTRRIDAYTLEREIQNARHLLDF
jgi:D-amino peptidase